MDRNAQIERAWQLMLGAQRDLVHAEEVARQKREQFDRANAHLRSLLAEETIADEHIVAHVLEVA